ncbi:LysM peptidoglycan-binding domain-containing M23 family metallopeptidase [Fischerella thermalis]|uniref:LysM peptidoglycan-binding domain-containing M23 family metallopeptidase n=1 Tax=Fischerella thermalis TaxID=372787 RepID=UPI000C80032C|nr:M23 family metallopeptidase [Fischerella thermalis]PLZ90507.1 peptidase [Fischerella thermalis CCMEE 5194]
MTVRDRLLLRIFSSLISALGLISTRPNPVLAQVAKCPTPALERFQRHRVAPGETLQSIAQLYNLAPDTIITMNLTLKNGRVSAGNNILIPPYDGIVVEVARGETWRELAQRYKVRADALFELNGCKPPSQIAFIPTPNQALSRANVSTSPSSSGNSPAVQINGYPLPSAVQVGFPYGWQLNPNNGEVFFHSGIDLLAAIGTPVKAIAAGTVVFAGDRGTYGNLVIINHANGLQSRYAQLESIKVGVGQQVKQGDLLGTVGKTGQPTITQPHLHFEIRSNSSLGWVAKDPAEHLKSSQ